MDIFMESLNRSLMEDRKIEMYLNDAMVEFYEMYENTHYVSESHKASLSERVKRFIDRIIAQLKKFSQELSANIKNAVANKKVKKNLKKTKSLLQKAKDNGATTVTTIDVIAYKQRYMQCYKSLWKIARRFDKVEYSSVKAIDADLKNFNAMYDKYTAELKELGETKVEKDIDEMIRFCDYELDGTSAVFKTLNDTETNLQQMKISADALEKKRNVLGDEVIPKRVNVIQRVAMKITTFVKDCVTKFIMTVVFVFA